MLRVVEVPRVGINVIYLVLWLPEMLACEVAVEFCVAWGLIYIDLAITSTKYSCRRKRRYYGIARS